MKKILIWISIILIFLGNAYAESEITFSNIPWLSEDDMVIQKLTETGLIRSGSPIPILENGKTIYIVQDDSGFIYPNQITSLQEVSYTGDLKGYVKGKIAGYVVNNLKLSFAYDGAYKLIAVEIDLLNCKYSELKEKLAKVYGEGEEFFNEEDIGYTIWRGANNSCILLFTYIKDIDYTLMYGRIDAVEILEDCLKVAPDDISGI